MLKEVEKVYNDAVLQQAIQHYDLTQQQLTLIDSNTDVVHEYQRNHQAYILKLIHSSQATHNFVCGEMDWVNYLAENGLSVSRPVFSSRGNLVELVPVDSSYFSVVAFEKAPGIHVGYEEDPQNAQLFRVCGEFVGKMHALSKRYSPSNPAFKRPDWRQFDQKRRYPPEIASVYAKRQALMNIISSFPQNTDNYGLIHGDFHSFNFSVDNGAITVFDFAECSYAWFTYELAVILYHVLDLPYLGDDYDEFGHFFMQHFMPAYLQENWLNPTWQEQIPVFLRLREISIYSYIHCNWDNDGHPAVQNWMNACRHRIDNDLPIAQIDFSDASFQPATRSNLM